MMSLQDTYGPETICFGCGPANPDGLRIKSFPRDDETVVAEWTPAPHHQAFPGILNGGIIGALLDCHSNWSAAWWLMQRRASEAPPVTVTADFHVRLRRPTPSDGPVRLTAEIAELADPRVVVDATLEAGGKVCATCRGTFIAVEPGHPAHDRW